jgi:GTP-binding protein EngB required for normal cell division
MTSEAYLVFTGRPNSGKSSLIRLMTGLKVAVGRMPGTTDRIERYPIAGGLTLVDMPGYGRSLKSPRWREEETKDSILGFLRENAGGIVLIVHVVNASTFLETEARLGRKGFIPLDVEMVQYMRRDLGLRVLVAANKMDRGGAEEMAENLEALRGQLGPTVPVYPVSARTGEGVGGLKAEVHRRLVEAGFRSPLELLR